jgi:chemotaxis protein methyltransferase CheR
MAMRRPSSDRDTGSCPLDARREPELSDAHFWRISGLVRELCGINLTAGKKPLVRARLRRRLGELGLRGYDQYVQHLLSDPTGHELAALLDAISTNLTGFFREPAHFDYLWRVIIPRAIKRRGRKRRFRVWSAGCSSGEEPYSIAITLREALPTAPVWDVRILATDLATAALKRAAQGVYSPQDLTGLPGSLVRKYFERMPASRSFAYRVTGQLRRMVTVGRLNLMADWPMKGPFDVIFCRNVMIYFDKQTQGMLVNRFAHLLASGGTLLIGHSESLTGVSHNLRYIQPAVYEKR